MRIREDGKHAHRTETIEQAAEFWECNKTRALLLSADFAPQMDKRIRAVLSREDLTSQQKHEMANTLSIPGRYTVAVDEQLSISKG